MIASAQFEGFGSEGTGLRSNDRHRSGEREKGTRRVPLEGAATCAEAVKAMAQFEPRRDDNPLPMLKRTPTFSNMSIDSSANLWFNYIPSLTCALTAPRLRMTQGRRLWISP